MESHSFKTFKQQFGKFVQCLKLRGKSKNPIGQKVKMSGKSVREEWY